MTVLMSNHHDQSMNVQATVAGFLAIRLVVHILSSRHAFSST